MNTEQIAKVCQEVNKAYCEALGDTSQKSWEDAPDWQKDSVLNGVQMHLDNPDATPRDSHKSWFAQKLKEGWTYGEAKDVDKKQHPCMTDYDSLPTEQKAKDSIFRQIVHSLKDL